MLIETFYSYVYGDHTVVKHYFYWDGIHFSNRGSRTLVSLIQNTVDIIKHKNNGSGESRRFRPKRDGFRFRGDEGTHSFGGERRCRNCGLRNHETRNCRRRY